MQAQDYGWLTLEEIKQAAVIDRLGKLNNNQTKTAESLGITRPTLAKIIEEYGERTEKEQIRIKSNQAELSRQEKMNADAFQFDPSTGMSLPKSPAPIPPVTLFKPRPTLDQSAIEEAMSNAEGSVDRKNLFVTKVEPSPVIKLPDPVLTAAQIEHERFAKLDKTPYSVKHKTQERENRERQELAGEPVGAVDMSHINSASGHGADGHPAPVVPAPVAEISTPAPKAKKDSKVPKTKKNKIKKVS